MQAVGPVALLSLLLRDRLEPLVPGSEANVDPNHPVNEAAQTSFNAAAIQVQCAQAHGHVWGFTCSMSAQAINIRRIICHVVAWVAHGPVIDFRVPIEAMVECAILSVQGRVSGRRAGFQRQDTTAAFNQGIQWRQDNQSLTVIGAISNNLLCRSRFLEMGVNDQTSVCSCNAN